MASFFQPSGSSGDPVIAACNSSPNDRQVYCNRIVPLDKRLKTVLQSFTLLFSALCVALPAAAWVGRRFYRQRFCQELVDRQVFPYSLLVVLDSDA